MISFHSAKIIGIEYALLYFVLIFWCELREREEMLVNEEFKSSHCQGILDLSTICVHSQVLQNHGKFKTIL